MKIWWQVAGACLLAFVAILLPAITVHAPNAASFTSPALPVLLPFLGAFLVGWALLLLLARIARWSPRLLAVYLTGTLILLLCSQIFGQTESFVLDGVAHELTIPPIRSAVEGAIILAVAVAGLLFWRRIAAIAGTAIIALGFWACASGLISASAYLTQEAQTSQTSQTSQTALPFSALSSDFNVIHVMFDSLRSDAFATILADHPELGQKLDGFTFYPDHAGYSNWTTISLGAILADKLYFDEPVNDLPANELFGRWIAQDSLPARLDKAGFDVGMMPPGRIFCGGAAFHCATLDAEAEQSGVDIGGSADPAATLNAERILLANLSLLRLAPSSLKPSVYRQGAYLIPTGKAAEKDSLTPIQRDIVLSRDVARHLAENLAIGTDKPVYRFLHFYPPHRPFMLDAACQQVAEGEDDWPTYMAQATCSVRLFARFVDKLKELGVYDRTVIVLQSDTGLNVLPDGAPGEAVTQTEIYDRAQLMGYARPALAIKPLSARGDLTVSSQPTHQRDTFRLLAEAARDENGDPLLDLSPKARGDDTVRPFVVSGPVRPHTRRLAPFEQFAISGPVDAWQSWRFEGAFEAPGKPLAAQRPITSVDLAATPKGPVALGQEIRLSANVTGGTGQPVLMFFRRTEDGKFAIVSPRGFANDVAWTVEDGNRDACKLELLVAARNELDPEDAQLVGELAVPLSKPGC